ncbi:MAG TPA: alpha/beta hydrolase [Bacillota bacterium]|nr:alpha/beta hydrolase [Bacillota bacterium]
MKPNPILLLPGWGMEASIWFPLQRKLGSEFLFTCIEWDGISTIADFNERVEEWIREQHSPFILLGWSLGSLVALDIASTFPSQVSHLILFAGTSRFTIHETDLYKEGWNPRIIEKMKCKLVRDKERTLSSFYDSMFTPAEQEQGWLEQFIHLKNKHFNEDTVESLTIGLDYLIQMDFREKIQAIECPMLLIHGEEDTICPITASQYIARHAKSQVMVKSLPGVGHLPFFSRAQECVGWMKDFVGV